MPCFAAEQEAHADKRTRLIHCQTVAAWQPLQIARLVCSCSSTKVAVQHSILPDSESGRTECGPPSCTHWISKHSLSAQQLSACPGHMKWCPCQPVITGCSQLVLLPDVLAPECLLTAFTAGQAKAAVQVGPVVADSGQRMQGLQQLSPAALHWIRVVWAAGGQSGCTPVWVRRFD